MLASQSLQYLDAHRHNLKKKLINSRYTFLNIKNKNKNLETKKNQKINISQQNLIN